VTHDCAECGETLPVHVRYCYQCNHDTWTD